MKVDKEEQHKNNNNDNEETTEFKIVYLFLLYNLLLIVLCGYLFMIVYVHLLAIICVSPLSYVFSNSILKLYAFRNFIIFL